MNRDRLLLFVGLGTFFTAALYFMTGKSPFPVIGIGAVAAVAIFAFWDLPKRLKSKADPHHIKTADRIRSAVISDPGVSEDPSRKIKRKKRNKRR